jgi:hypothetical protein
MVENPERKDLFELLEYLENELNYVVGLISNTPGIIPEWLKWDLKSDWEAVRPRFNAARESLAQAGEEELNNHGLAGSPLKSKIIFLKRSTTRVRWQISRIHWPATGILRKSLAWLLDVQDNLLESLADVLPPLGAVTELKKQLESSLVVPDVVE